MTPLQVFLSVSGLILSVTFGLAVYLVPKHRVRQKFFDRALGNSGTDGMPPHDDIFTILERVVHQLNGGGFGGQIHALDEKVTDHIEEANRDRRQIKDDVREARADVAGVARLFSMEIQKLDEKVTDNLEKATGDLQHERERARYLEASLNEVFSSPDEAPTSTD